MLSRARRRLSGGVALGRSLPYLNVPNRFWRVIRRTAEAAVQKPFYVIRFIAGGLTLAMRPPKVVGGRQPSVRSDLVQHRVYDFLSAARTGRTDAVTLRRRDRDEARWTFHTCLALGFNRSALVILTQSR